MRFFVLLQVWNTANRASCRDTASGGRENLEEDGMGWRKGGKLIRGRKCRVQLVAMGTIGAWTGQHGLTPEIELRMKR